MAKKANNDPDEEARRAIALAMIEARLQAAQQGGDPAAADEEIDALAGMAEEDAPSSLLSEEATDATPPANPPH